MGGLIKRKKKKAEAELDITAMIDVTFLLLIFFMVTSTMQGTPDQDTPAATSGENANAAGYIGLKISAPDVPGAEGVILLGDLAVSLDQLKAELIQKVAAAAGEEVKVMIYADRDVKSGFIGEVEQVISEVSSDTDTTIAMGFAVRDRR